MIAVGLLLSLIVGFLRGRLPRVWADAHGRILRQGTRLTVTLFVGLVATKFARGTLAYFWHVDDGAGLGEVLVMIAVMIAVQAELRLASGCCPGEGPPDVSGRAAGRFGRTTSRSWSARVARPADPRRAVAASPPTSGWSPARQIPPVGSWSARRLASAGLALPRPKPRVERPDGAAASVGETGRTASSTSSALANRPRSTPHASRR